MLMPMIRARGDMLEKYYQAPGRTVAHITSSLYHFIVSIIHHHHHQQQAARTTNQRRLRLDYRAGTGKRTVDAAQGSARAQRQQRRKHAHAGRSSASAKRGTRAQ